MHKAFEILKTHSKLGVVFSLAKATVFFTPLLLADVLSKEAFGILEYALAGLGMVVNSIINLGVPGAYPYFILRQKALRFQDAFKLHPLILLIPFILNQILFYVFDLNINFYLAFNVSYIIANQTFYSTRLKSHEKSVFAVIMDSGLYILLLLYYLLFTLNILKINIVNINITIQLYCYLYILYGVYKFYQIDKNEILFRYKQILKFSSHLLISTFLIFLITTSGRILIELFFDFSQVGIYAYYFRLSAIVVMIHQIVNIAFFKKIYTANPIKLDNYYFVFFVMIFLISMVTYLIAPLVLNHFSSFFNDTYNDNKAIYFLLSVQMVMWIATALNSNIIDRENLTSKNNPKFIALIIFSCGILYLLRNMMSLSLLTFIHLSIIYFASLIQYESLYKSKIIFKKSFFTLSVIYLVSTYTYFSFL
ncbi:polysaccharide biosynthesis protein [Aestuariivivens sediminicola]|uniref:hypothetical protein n=1 Tax=Aestuariivivens sediminicola TaxID=2913560 RepID=UPI001F58A419|nr:hypothetical protein [Aestuariivivens sediminicola]